MKNQSTKKLVLSGIFIALGLVLPFLTGQIQSLGNALLPMHIPVLLCGFLLGWPYGLIVGFITPLLRSVVFGMPPMIPFALAMAFELATYGSISGLLYKLMPKKNVFIYAALIIAMVCGRAVWGIAGIFVYRLGNIPFTWSVFAAGAFLNAIPGIVLQIVLIPVIVAAIKRAGLLLNE
ncbi:MAG TPA: ECF transporter S component [Clostridiaceae bacterium]|jgi:riboflavin transporter FmnP|nr:ECF transporter S component [Clostridiaceae bacterium]